MNKKKELEKKKNELSYKQSLISNSENLSDEEIANIMADIDRLNREIEDLENSLTVDDNLEYGEQMQIKQNNTKNKTSISIDLER